MTKNVYLVERLVVEYQLVTSNSEEEAIKIAEEHGDWDTEPLTEGDNLYYGTKVGFIRICDNEN